MSLFSFASKAQTSSLAFSRNPRTFETVQSSLFVKGLGHACLAIKNIPDSLPCNPANVPFQKVPKLSLEVLLSNGYSALEKVQKIIDEELSDELIDSFFSENNVLQIEANAELDFQTNVFNAKYTPISVRGLSVVRNEANPDVELSLVEESGFVFQTGFQLLDDFYFGTQFRFLERKFIRQRFKLLTLGTAEGKDLLKPKEQTATFIEPGVTWILGKKWQPRVSAFVANLGSVSEQFDELPTPIDFQFALAISPPLQWGQMDLTVEYKSLTFEEASDLEKIRVGAAYNFGALNLMGGVDANGLSGGVFFAMEQVDAGVLFTTTKLTNKDNDYFTQTVYVQLGWRI